MCQVISEKSWIKDVEGGKKKELCQIIVFVLTPNDKRDSMFDMDLSDVSLEPLKWETHVGF